MAKFFSLLKTQLVLEARYRETLVLLLSISIMLSTIVALGIQNSFLGPGEREKLYPVLVWLVFVFSATVSIGRSFEYEVENRAIDALVMSGISTSVVYIAKVTSNFILLIATQVVTLLFLSILLNIPIGAYWGPLLIISVMVVFAYAAVATLCAAMTLTARMRQMLLPLILIPLLIPIFYAATEVSQAALYSHTIEWSSFWASLLLLLDLVYIVLGINLFEFVVKE